MRRATASLAVVLVTAACAPAGPPPPPSAPAGADWNERGPITYAQGSDPAGVWPGVLARWNAAHPNEQVTLIELSPEADQQRAEMIKRGRAKSGEFSVMSVDVVWAAEFADNGWLQELPGDQFPTTGLLASAVDGATYRDQLYGYPQSADGGMLYYRKDLLDQAGLAPPTTWAEMQAACEAVLAGQEDMWCYAGQHHQDEGLTANIAEAVNSAGGDLVTAGGLPAVNTPEAVAGLKWLVDGFESGRIPADAITWTEEEGRRAFQEGKLLFHRDWSQAWHLASRTDGSAQVAGKFAVAPLPGRAGPGIATVGGHFSGISPFARNKGTAADFVRWLAAPEIQQVFGQQASLGPVLAAMYTDPEAAKTLGYLPTLGQAISSGRARPKTVRYGEVTSAIQDSAYSALNGRQEADVAFAELQDKLVALLE